MITGDKKMATVKEWIEILKKENPNALVVLSKDGEGNSYSPLDSIDVGVYVENNHWSGEVFPKEITEDMRKAGFTNEDLYDGLDGIDALILYPPS
jgi:hypothetical protein